ncbi:MAG: hypothetical protein KC996_08080 [Phycisphaerales bacterium]|nr:hypothetical protein [Phycisphaerales bacterium]
MLIRAIISVFLVLLPMPLNARATIQAAAPMSDSCSMLEELDCACPLCVEINECVCEMGSDNQPLPDKQTPIAPAPGNPLPAALSIEPDSIPMPIGIEPVRSRAPATTRIASPPSVAVFLSMVCIWTT